MIARAFGVGIDTAPPCEDSVPIGVVELGTWESQRSSSRESTASSSVYQDPAWVGWRTVGAMGAAVRKKMGGSSVRGLLEVVKEGWA